MGEPEKLSALPRHRAVQGTVRALGLLGVAVGVLGLRTELGSPPIAPDSALACILLGIALGLATFDLPGSFRAAALFAGVVPVLALFSLGLQALPVASRMPPSAALGFTLIAAAILVARSWTRASQLLALVAGGLGLGVVLARLYGIPLAYPTAVVLMTTASGVFFLHPQRGLAAALLDPSEAGRQLRRLGSAALLPALLGWLLVTGSRAPWHQSVDTVLLVIAFMLSLLGLAAWSYVSLRISDEKRRAARVELAASEARYRRTFEHARIGIAHVAPDGRWLQVNQRLVEILGYEASDLLAKTYADVSYLEDLEVDVKQWELLRRGEISDYAVERRFHAKNGEIVHADVRIAREEDEAGGLRHFIVVLQDVTARKLSDGTRRVYERALAATQSGVVITDARQNDHPIVYANPAFLELTGYSSAELIGKNCRLLNEKAREQAALDELRRAIAAGESCSVLVRNHRKNGEAFWNQLSIAPVEDSTGRVTHFVGVMIDATERVQGVAEREDLLAQAQSARHEAESANRAKDRFLSVVSHELRSPLNAILAWTSLLRDEPGEEVARVVRSIEASVHSQSRLVNELLDASRIRQGALQIEPVPIDLEPVVRNAVSRMAPIASERGIALEVETRGPAPLFADEERIEQVVGNLIDNALKFTPKGGRVDVRLWDRQEVWRIEVRDNGRGIAADALPHVFQEFWQGGESSGRGAGLGLGLLIVKHLVERHGGTVRIESEGRDRGTTVEVDLPRSRATAPEAAGVERADLKGLEVVVVDDDDPTVQALGLALGRVGAICRLATSVPEALRLFEGGTPDLLVSDIGLPDRDGFDLIRSLRALDEPVRSVLAIAVTGLVEPEEQRRIRRAGFDAYLAKPVAPDVVIDRMIRLRALQLAQSSPPRRVLILDAVPETSSEIAAALRRKGHAVHQVREPVEALEEATAFRPQLILARISAGLNSSALAERLAARGVRASLVGMGEDGSEDQKGLDAFLALPPDPEALDRLLRFAEET
jgi:PAS domain S-box-containing protein